MSPDPVDRSTAPHAVWDEVCDAYHLLDRQELSVVEQVVPPGTETEQHAHQRSRQFFYLLRGRLTVGLGRQEHELTPGAGLEIPARTGHHVRNDTDEPAEVLVISSPRVGGSQPARSGSRRPLRQDRGAPLVASHLRPTRRADLDDVIAFEEARDTRRFLGQGGRPWHEGVLTDPDMEHLVLVDRLDRVLAFAILAGLSDHRAVEIRRMVVAPEGRGHGLGRMLLRLLLEQALADAKVSRVWLDVSEDNTRARSLYRTVGFVERPAPPEAVLLENGIYMEWSATRPAATP